MSIEKELNDYVTYLGSAYDKCFEKGAVIPLKKNLMNLTDCIDSITGDPTTSGWDDVAIPEGTEYLFHFDDTTENTINKNEKFNRGSLSSSPALWGNAFNPSGNASISLASIIPNVEELRIGRIIDTETNERSAPLNLTIEFWVYANYNNGYCMMYGNGSTGTAFSGIYVSVSGSSVSVYIGSNSTYKSISCRGNYLKAWTHVAVVFKSGTMMLFVNGIKAGENNKIVDAANNIGRSFVLSYGSGTYFDEVLISTEALYENSFEVHTAPYRGIKTLTRLYVYKQPTKTIYESGERFDLSGAKIIAEYSNGSSGDVTEDCKVLETDPITLGTEYRTVTYTYRGLTKTAYINVGVYTTEPTLDLSATKLLMNFDGNTVDLTRLNEVTIAGNNLYGEGKFGQARHFNGTTDYISMPYTDDININTGDFTVACWVKFASTLSASGVIIGNAKFTSSSNKYGWRIVANTGMKIYVAIANSNNTNVVVANNVSPADLIANNWNHLALVRKGDIITFYVNGKKASSITFSGTMTCGDTLNIGGWRNYSNTFADGYVGYIDDLIITKSALWEGEFTPPSQPYSIVKDLEERALYELNDGGGVE